MPLKSSLQGLHVVAFESRRAQEMAELIRRYGGEPVMAPSMREVPLSENHVALQLLPQLEAGTFDLLILMTGVGTKALFETLLTRYPQQRILTAFRRVQLIARGPKPVAALKALGLVPAVVASSPNTWRELLAAMDGVMRVAKLRIAIQEYGIANGEFVRTLERRGARVTAIPIYRWALPVDLAPLRAAVARAVSGKFDIALFTNGAQVEHLFKIAAEQANEQALRLALRKMVVASVGPVCTEVLHRFALVPDIEATPPKMGALIAAIAGRAGEILHGKKQQGPGYWA